MKNINIIKKNQEFQSIIGNKQFIKTKGFVIYFKENNFKRFRYGISVGKKMGNAVLRNKIKRRVRSMVWELLDNQSERYFDVIIITRIMIFDKDYKDNLEDLKKSLSLIK